MLGHSYTRDITFFYAGVKAKLKDKYALGNYKLLAITNINKSPVYLKEDEAHGVTEAPGSRSFIFRNWDDDKWIGTVKSMSLFIIIIDFRNTRKVAMVE